MRVWDLTANRCALELYPEGDAPVASVAVSADASVAVAANYNGAVYAWRPGAGAGTDAWAPARRLQAHAGYVLAARISPDTRLLATASSDRTVRLWSTADFSLQATLAQHTK